MKPSSRQAAVGILGLQAGEDVKCRSPSPVCSGAQAYEEPLARIGYTHIDVGAFHAVYPFYQRPDEWPTTHHVHLCRAGSREELTHLVFRDYLRDQPETAAEYEALKRVLAAAQQGTSFEDRERYSLAKTPFILATVERALAEGYGASSVSED